MDKSVDYSIFAADQNYIQRIHEEEEHIFRNKFQRDRDRILYSKEFRRLSGKTQVFVGGFDDHARTRLTHTLEVAQITNTICRELGLNEDLGEAISIGHDIGHTPFGHIGERTLNYIMTGCDDIKGINTKMKNEYKGFKHNWQGLRVTMDLEKTSRDFNGLNLTPYTLWGILNHSSTKYSNCDRKFENEDICSLRRSLNKCNGFENMFSLNFYDKYNDKINDCWTIEALVVSQADEIAQRHHDIEDALEAGIIEKDELIEEIEDNFGCWLKEGKWMEDLNKIKNEKDKDYLLSKISKLIVDFLTNKYIDDLKETLDYLSEKYDIQTKNDFYKMKSIVYKKESELLFQLFSYEESFKVKEEKFQDYMKNRILNSFLAQSMDGKSNFIIRQLIKAYITNPQQLQDKTIYTLYREYLPKNDWIFYENQLEDENKFKRNVGELRNKLNNDYFTKTEERFNMILLRVVCDYIAGMTDNYAIEQYNLLYGSKHIGQV